MSPCAQPVTFLAADNTVVARAIPLHLRRATTGTRSRRPIRRYLSRPSPLGKQSFTFEAFSPADHPHQVSARLIPGSECIPSGSECTPSILLVKYASRPGGSSTQSLFGNRYPVSRQGRSPITNTNGRGFDTRVNTSLIDPLNKSQHDRDVLTYNVVLSDALRCEQESFNALKSRTDSIFKSMEYLEHALKERLRRKRNELTTDH